MPRWHHFSAIFGNVEQAFTYDIDGHGNEVNFHDFLLECDKHAEALGLDTYEVSVAYPRKAHGD